MVTSDFAQPTSTEKFNDKKYRGLIYHPHQNESFFPCQSKSRKASIPSSSTPKKQKKQLQQSLTCRPGCTNQCCSDIQKQLKDIVNMKNDEARNNNGSAIRMRGGGSGELASNNILNGDFTWYNSKFNSRLEGGGCGGGEVYPNNSCGKSGRQRNGNGIPIPLDSMQWDSITPQFLAGNRCKLKHNEDKTDKPVCSCPERDYLESIMRKKGHGVCTKKPCMGPDCLIKAFKDAQDFVDSIGKGPGLAGLGLVESPYFGTRTKEPKETKKSESKTVSINKMPETANSLCNNQNIENLKNLNNNVNSSIYPSLSSKKPVVVKEGVPDPAVVAAIKAKKKDEKSEKPKETESNLFLFQNNEESPCGEPRCKSRPKKTNTEPDCSAQLSALQEKLAALQKHAKKKMGQRSRSNKTQFVYSFGDAYPASVYGHKKCNLDRERVPAKMGWMWNKTDTIAKLKPRPGWRPGAISTTLRDLLKEAKLGYFKEARRSKSVPSKVKQKGNKPRKGMSSTAVKKSGAGREEEEEEEIEFPPTLHIHRKDGVYYVTMYPIRPDTTDAPRLDEPTNPLQFKIVKSRDSLASSSTASDMEIEFSPPAAVNRLKKKPNVVHIETQVKQQDILDAFKKPSDSKKKDSKKEKRKSK